MEFFAKIKSALKKTSNHIALSISGRRAGHDLAQGIEEALIMADVGVAVAAELSRKVTEEKFSRDTTDEDIKLFLANEIALLLAPYQSNFFQQLSIPPHSTTDNTQHLSSTTNPHIMLMIGVNGNGKTTTLAKITHMLKQSHHRPLLVAADTFRAAAVDQLRYWANYISCDFSCAPDGADAAGLVFQSIKNAKSNGNDLVLIDTAGRLQNRDDLLAELEKIKKVIKKIDAAIPLTTILILDGITGQAAHGQVDVFLNKIGVDGIIVTKLDGTAKGGAIVSLVQKYKIPVFAIGVGEGIDDLKPFNVLEYARSLVGH
ncbi:MAG: signal recognition particle-docking protein FtsY [Holosporaceae bacterium]|jgi:fused signal recognition particle receptor|nr:signal recognition particle-docking protein FtsY [Holosporaceae bacterium]